MDPRKLDRILEIMDRVSDWGILIAAILFVVAIIAAGVIEIILITI